MPGKQIQIVAEPFSLRDKPVRVVRYKWREDKEYLNAEAEGIEDVYQVTWAESDDPLVGWVANIHRLYSGGWTVGDQKGVTFATRDQAALQAVLDWEAYKGTLTAEDYRQLTEMLIPAMMLPGTRCAPREE